MGSLAVLSCGEIKVAIVDDDAWTGREVDADDACVLLVEDWQLRCLRKVPFLFTRKIRLQRGQGAKEALEAVDVAESSGSWFPRSADASDR